MTSLSMPAEIYSELMDHLSSEEVEHVAFLFTEPAVPGAALRVREIYRVPAEGFDFQTASHVALTDDVRGYVIKRAWDLDGCLIEVHSHGGGPPVWFSGSDLHGFVEWVQHVRWRLRRRVYVALVFAGSAFDALVWEGDGDEPSALDELAVDGRDAEAPSGITYLANGHVTRNVDRRPLVDQPAGQTPKRIIIHAINHPSSRRLRGDPPGHAGGQTGGHSPPRKHEPGIGHIGRAAQRVTSPIRCPPL